MGKRVRAGADSCSGSGALSIGFTNALNNSWPWAMRHYRYAFGTTTTPLDGQIANPLENSSVTTVRVEGALRNLRAHPTSV
jgi:hypothetical protein